MGASFSKDKGLLVGVIGAGNRGWLSKHAYNPDEGVRLAGAVDINDAVLESYRETYGPDLPATTDYRELLGRHDIRAILVTSPDFRHEDHAVDADIVEYSSKDLE